ncbi:Aste57867_4534 [Aphanomyces stellatus]|uniref:Aste57867_4534 protein n=1 Tax=Aphanomyces stellatus TaxID=120398 RepID=A0A485KE24_9STRA|nr:hypothetical protein As57867_004521 [Aphanomyces stellatus]VFT81643.1 Aste57867_4534 [Aphanomyces stellatus]
MSLPTSPVRSLSYAAKSGDLALARILIEEDGQNFHEHDAFNVTPFQHACLHGHPQIVQLLLTLYARDKMTLHALELEVCKRGCFNPELRKYLKGEQTIGEAVANDTEGTTIQATPSLVTRRDNDHRTALYYACTHNHSIAVAFLVSEFKSYWTTTELVAEIDECRAVATSSDVRGLLDGTLTLKHIMAAISAAKKQKALNVKALPKTTSALQQHAS